MTIYLKNDAGMVKSTPLGFSWTTLFFGGCVPLLRGDLKWFFIMIFLSFLTLGISWLIVPFIYNKIYLRNLVGLGWKPATEKDKEVLQKTGILALS